MNRVGDITKKLIWSLAALSIASCLLRCDYNVIFSFFILIILNNFYNQNTKLFIKIIIQVLAVLVIADIIWIVVIMNTWKHNSTDKNEYWKSLSTLHTVVIILAYLELILKSLTIAYLVYDFKQKNPTELSELWKFTYIQQISAQKKPDAQNPNPTVEFETESNFKNPY